ncbi:MAG: outer membrane protein [Flammeovirgaceae bacterium]
MKKIILFAAMIMMLGLVAQEAKAQGAKRIGGQLAYGTKDLNLGFGARGEFNITDNISIVPKFTYYLGKSEAGVSVKGWALDADAHYYFTTDGLNFYALAGLAYSNRSSTVPATPAIPPFFPGTPETTDSDRLLGLNIGGGVNFAQSESLVPFAEVRYNTGFKAVLISAGVSFPIGK